MFLNRWNQESAGRVYFNISREKLTRSHAIHAARSTALVQTWMDQSETHLLFFAETNQRQYYSRVPQSSWSLSSTCTEELWVEIAINFRYYGLILRTPLLVPTAQFYCSSKSRYNGHQLAFFSILAELFQIIVYFFLFFSSSLSLWLKSDHSDSRLTWSFYETTTTSLI